MKILQLPLASRRIISVTHNVWVSLCEHLLAIRVRVNNVLAGGMYLPCLRKPALTPMKERYVARRTY